MNVVVVSWNEKGFWQGDLWRDWSPDAPEGISPDGFFTTTKDTDYLMAIDRAITLWGDVYIRFIPKDVRDD